MVHLRIYGLMYYLLKLVMFHIYVTLPTSAMAVVTSRPSSTPQIGSSSGSLLHLAPRKRSGVGGRGGVIVLLYIYNSIIVLIWYNMISDMLFIWIEYYNMMI